METLLVVSYWILKEIKKIGRKIFKIAEKWIGNQYRIRIRWKKAQLLIPGTHRSLVRVKMLATQRESENQMIRNQNDYKDIENDELTAENRQLLKENMDLNVKIMELQKQLTKKSQPIVKNLPKSLLTYEDIGKLPECFRQFDETSKKCKECKWAKSCDMRVQHDLKLLVMKDTEPVKYNLTESKEVTNPDILPVATAIRDGENLG